MKKAVSIGIIALLLLVVAVAADYGVRTHRAADRERLTAIGQWRILWGDGSTSLQQAQTTPPAKWLIVTERDALPQKPPNASSAWVQIELPKFDSDRYGVYIPELYAQNVAIYSGSEKLEEMRQRHPYDVRRILLPLNLKDSGRTLYLKIDTRTERIGIAASIWFGPYDKLLPLYVTRELDSVAIGFALLFIALVMLICSIFLQRTQRPAWVSLGVVIFALGSINVTYSTFSYAFYGEYGEWFVDIFDLSLDVFLPVMTYFFEQVFGDGKRRLLYKFRSFQTFYSAACVLFLIVNHASGYRFAGLYFIASVTVTGCIMLVQMVLLIGTATIYALRKNKDALIFSSGVVVFALLVAADLVLFYKNDQSSQFYLWRWGLVIFVISLIVILGRRLAV